MRRIGKVAMGGVAAAAAISAARRWYGKLELKGKSVLITGGSRGLGLELAREYARHGARLTILARDPDELAAARAELHDADVVAVECDVRDRVAVERAMAGIADVRGPVDVLVNVAGIIDVAPFEHLTDEDFQDSLDTHLWGPLRLSREAARRMAPGGRIVNVSSIGGLVPVPHLLAYSVGKFALTGLSEGLQAELSLRGIRVTTVCPGLMRTGSHVNARFKGRHRQEFSWFSASAGFPLASMNARRAAKKIVAASAVGRPFLVLTPQARALHLLHALAPNTTGRAMALVARMLPGPTDADGNRKRMGWESTSRAAPSALTRLADRAIERNNQLSERSREAYKQKVTPER